jgi:hypothetical protein
MAVDVQPPLSEAPVPAAAHSPDEQSAIAYVRALQQDGRLLLRHIARRADRTLAAGPIAGIGSGSTLQVLTLDPASIVTDRARLDALVATVDALSRQAAPATASTIRLTSAYLRLAAEGGEPPPEVMQRVWRVRLAILGMMLVAVVAMVSALVVLAHVDEGRRAVQQLLQVKTELRATFDELGRIPTIAWVTKSASTDAPPLQEASAEFVPFCPPEPSPQAAPAGPQYWRVPNATQDGARARAFCSQLSEASLREELSFMRLQGWNCQNYRYFELGILFDESCGNAPGTPLRPEGRITQQDWNRTEMRTGAAISKLTGFVLPLLMGCIGGCAYVLRRLDQKLSDSTLEVRDGWQAALRVLLATMLGGLLGAVWSGDQQLQLGGYTLSLAAVAFFVGFGLEAVFTVIEAMMEGVVGKLRAPPPPATIVVAAQPAAGSAALVPTFGVHGAAANEVGRDPRLKPTTAGQR